MKRPHTMFLPFLLTMALSFVATLSVAQRPDNRIRSIERNPADNTPTSISLNEGWTTNRTDELFRTLYGISGEDNKLVLTNTTLTKQGVRTDRYTQFYKGYKVELSSVAVTSRNDAISFVTSNIYKPSKALAATPAITEQQALDKALAAISAKRYIWQDETTEQSLKRYTGNPDTSNYPRGTLVWIENLSAQDHNRKLHLAYAFNIYAVQPLSRDMVYVDATTGVLLFKDPILKQALASGGSLYSGYLNFQVSPSGGYNILKDLTRGTGISTYSCAGAGLFYGAYATSSTMVFNTDAAIDAHWGAEKVYDYWMNIHGRNSYDNAGAAINSYVHYGTGYNNAFWDGTEMVYGDGTGIAGGGFSPLAAIDVCAHEIGHAVCTHTANLVYSGESGAMNEGFSDIWAAVIEEYADPHETDAVAKSKWKIGEEVSSSGLRTMNNPNLHGQPDTYGGTYWYVTTSCTPSGANDYCGVHKNSGVLNFWFYLLSQGGSGTNDIGNAYSVAGIGTERAANIAYQTELTLASTANFATCRAASINAAITLYGSCSPEVIAVTKAWYAVGVGANYTGTSIASVSGLSSVCAGSSITLSDATPSGTWTTGTPGVATVSATTGAVAGVASGTAVISYAIAGGCTATKIVTVNAPVSVGPISGLSTICAGSSAMQTNTLSGGSWSSSNTAVATISADYGVAAGVASGTATISYAITNACGTYSATKVMTVNAAPVITGSATICVGATFPLSCATAGGTWASDNVPVAIVVSSTGIVTGMAPGTANINYIVSSGCQATRQVTVTSATPIVFSDIPSSGLLGWYPFNGNGNNFLGTGKNGTVDGPTLTTDRYGNPEAAYYFHGDTDNITIDTPFFNVGWSNYTISCWFNSDTLDNPFNFNRGQAIINTIPHNGMAIYFSWLMYHRYEAFAGMPSSGWSIMSHNRFDSSTTHVWKHIAMVKKDDYTYKLYLDGVLDTVFNTSVLASTYYCKIVLGRSDPAIISEGFWGKLDDYGIWNRELSDSEVYRLYANLPGVAVVCAGGSTTLSNATPGGTWSSSSPTIATVNATTGVVTGVAAGSGTITYTYGAGCRATITITVHPAPAPISGTLAILPGGTATLASGTSGGTWSSSSTAVATIGSASGIVNGLTLGTSTISYRLTSTGCSTTAIVTVTPTAAVNGTVSVCDGITLSPNPNKGVFTLQGTLASKTNGQLTAEVINVLGQVVHKAPVHVRNGRIDEQLQLSNTLASGMYILNLHAEEGNKVFHFVLEQ